MKSSFKKKLFKLVNGETQLTNAPDPFMLSIEVGGSQPIAA